MHQAIMLPSVAKKMAHDCFRNMKELEEMHTAGQFSDNDMKALMTDVVDYCFDFLMELCSPHGAEIMDDLIGRDRGPLN
jgi:hypothetical protein